MMGPGADRKRHTAALLSLPNILVLIAAILAASLLESDAAAAAEPEGAAAAARGAGGGSGAACPCINGGRCRRHSGGSRRCDCSPGSAGDRCETILPGYYYDGSKVRGCPRGPYCTGGPVPGAGAATTPCPDHSSTLAPKKASLADCRLKPGFYCAYPPAGGACAVTACQPGSYCPGKASVTDQADPGIVACPSAACAPGCAPASPAGAADASQCSCDCAAPSPPPSPPPGPASTCTADDRYGLKGKQVQPEAARWLAPPSLRLPTLEEIKRVGDPLALVHPFPADVSADLQELLRLAALRDDPSALALDDPERPRRPVSRFLQLRPQPQGAVYDTTRGPGEPVVATGRELARWFENDTPVLAHSHALNHLFATTPGFSPPKQAQIWAALNLSTYAALLAAWHYKWDEPSTRLRPRPPECAAPGAGGLTVLYANKVGPNGAGDGDPVSNPEGYPGTPRHPSYPAGHSTVGGAASAVLARFFPEHAAELDDLADNMGMARLWAGIHYRADHRFGLALGRAVAGLVLDQLPAS